VRVGHGVLVTDAELHLDGALALVQNTELTDDGVGLRLLFLEDPTRDRRAL
jgi:hypothetical protein